MRSPTNKYTPQINYSGAVITDTVGWTKIEGSFIATGKENFITIGNFKDKAHTTYVILPPNPRNHGYWYTLYLVDDVSVVESDAKADAGPDTHVGYGDSVYIGLPSSEAIWNSWSVLGSSSVIGQGPGIWVKPKTGTSYVVSQNLCGNITTDTVRVDVWAAGITSINGQSQRYGLSPNPGKGFVSISQSLADEMPVNIEVYESTGRKAMSSSVRFRSGTASLDLSALPPGIYFLRLLDGNGVSSTLRFVNE